MKKFFCEKKEKTFVTNEIEKQRFDSHNAIKQKKLQ